MLGHRRRARELHVDEARRLWVPPRYTINDALIDAAAITVRVAEGQPERALAELSSVRGDRAALRRTLRELELLLREREFGAQLAAVRLRLAALSASGRETTEFEAAGQAYLDRASTTVNGSWISQLG